MKYEKKQRSMRKTEQNKSNGEKNLWKATKRNNYGKEALKKKAQYVKEVWKGIKGRKLWERTN